VQSADALFSLIAEAVADGLTLATHAGTYGGSQASRVMRDGFAAKLFCTPDVALHVFERPFAAVKLLPV